MDGNAAVGPQTTLTILDDYQSVALGCADWSDLAVRHRLDAVHEHLTGDALIERRCPGRCWSGCRRSG